MVIPTYADILLVEHDSREADLTKTAILKSKLTDRVHWVQDGQEALHFIFGRDKYLGRNMTVLPRIVILDLNIPETCRIEVIKLLKGNSVTKKIIVITFSGLQADETFSEAINAGVNICLHKNNDFDVFSDMLKQELGYFWQLFKNNS